MTTGIGITAASAAPASTSTSTGGDSFFAARGARLGRVFLRLRQKLGRIEQGHMRVRQGGGPWPSHPLPLCWFSRDHEPADRHS